MNLEPHPVGIDTAAYVARLVDEKKAKRKRRNCAKVNAWRARNPDPAAAIFRDWESRNRSKRAEYKRRRYKTDPAENYRVRDYKHRKKFGISLADKKAIFESQGARCAVCGGDDSGSRSDWHTDHDHKTGKVRGVLCHHCNMLLGNAKDCVETLRQAITYLLRHQE
jgi:hypothetical protein